MISDLIYICNEKIYASLFLYYVWDIGTATEKS